MTRTARCLTAALCSWLAFTSLASSAFAQPSIPTVVLRAGDGEPGDAFGKRVAVSHGTLVVGAHGDDDRGLDAGAAYVFTLADTGEWVERQKLAPASLLAGDFFGWSVAIDGDVIVVGAPGDDRDASGTPSAASANRGAAYVFRRIGDVWTHEATLQDATVAAGDESGASVAVSGDSILVSAIYHDGLDYSDTPVADQGAVFAFRAERPAQRVLAWRMEHVFTNRTSLPGARLGFSLAIAGNMVSFGAPGTQSIQNHERRAPGWQEVGTYAGVGPDCRAGQVPATGTGARFRELLDLVADGQDVIAVDKCSYRSFTYAVANRVSTAGLVTSAGLTIPYTLSMKTGVARSAAGLYWWIAGATVLLGEATAGEPWSSGTDDGQGAAARFTGLRAVDVHEGTQAAYVIDGCAIRRVTTDMTVTTVAGAALSCGTSLDATALDARFDDPRDLQVVGDDVYVADGTTIRRLALGSGAVTTVAGQAGASSHLDGTGAAARFKRVAGLTFGSGVMTIADESTLRRMDLSGVVTTLAGDPAGPGSGTYTPVDGQGPAARVAATRLVSTGPGRVVFIDGVSVREVDDNGVVRSLAGLPESADLWRGWGYALTLGAERRAVGAPLASAPYSTTPRTGAAGLSLRNPTRLKALAALNAPSENSRYGTALSFMDAGVLVLGPSNGCVWTASGTCVNHALGTGSESTVHPVRMIRDTSDGWREWLALPTTGVLPNSQYGATLATEDARVFVGASEWDYRPQDPAPYGDIVGPGAVYVYDLSEVDIDGDTMPDLDEVTNGLDPSSATGNDGAAGDADLDGIANAAEIAGGTHATAPPANTRYFAEGATSTFFATELALLNPGSTDADVLLRFQKAGGTASQTRLLLPRGERRSIDVGAQAGMSQAEFATVIESSAPIVADRVMQWPATSPYGSHGEHALTAPSTTWYLAEGATHSGFDLFYLLQNPGTLDATVRIRFLRPSGTPIEKDYSVPAGARVNVWVNVEQFPEGSGNLALASTDVSAVIESTNNVPIVVERAVYLTRPASTPGAPPTTFEAGHESAGVTAPSERWFFAEGATGSMFDLFILIANPSALPATVRATYLLESGQTFQKTHIVAAGSRFTLWVDHETFDGIDGTPLENVAVSTTLEVLNGVGVVAERAMWWPGPDFGTWSEAHNSPGATVTASTWGVAAGRVTQDVPGRNNVDTYLLVANPGDTAAYLTVSMVPDNGEGTETRYFTAPPHSRLNIDVKAAFGLVWRAPVDYTFSATVSSHGSPVVVEWAIYQDAGGQFWAAGANGLATPIQ